MSFVPGTRARQGSSMLAVLAISMLSLAFAGCASELDGIPGPRSGSAALLDSAPRHAEGSRALPVERPMPLETPRSSFQRAPMSDARPLMIRREPFCPNCR